jgi:hypothetical protein
MSQKPDGGPAFPARDFWSDDGGKHWHGMTLRDHFAGQALAGICASGPTIDNERIAGEAYRLADAMIAERDK